MYWLNSPGNKTSLEDGILNSELRTVALQAPARPLSQPHFEHKHDDKPFVADLGVSSGYAPPCYCLLICCFFCGDFLSTGEAALSI